MSKTFGFFKDMIPRGNVTSSNYPVPTYNVTVTTSNVDYANKVDTINFIISTNLTNNQTIFLTTANASGAVFSDGSSTFSAPLASNGNITISRKIAISSTDANNYTANFQLRTGDFTGDVFFSTTANISTTNAVATGGTILSNVAGHKVHQFNVGSANFEVTNGLGITAEYLIVGGGGTAGGWYADSAGLDGGQLSIWANSRGKWSGGGGGGQVITGNVAVAQSTVYPINVGNGGLTFLRNITGGTTGSQLYRYPAPGNATSAFGITSSGGGAGSWVALNLLFTGALYRFKAHTNNTGGGARPAANCVASVWGFTGGNGANANIFTPFINNIEFGANTVQESNMFAGGGAGAGGAGTDAVNFTLAAGNGGSGVASNINGTSLFYGAGGRGGGGDFIGSPVFGSNGTGWGNWGSGGGAGNSTGTVSGQNGVVFVKYPAYQKSLSV
jgi:hypothetical protein